MTLEFRIILVIASVLTVALILARIRKSKVRIDDSVFWILLSAFILLISIFPGVADAVTGALHIYLTTNFLFTFFIFLLLMKLFFLSVEVSQLKSKVEKLTQENALANKRAESRLAELEEKLGSLQATGGAVENPGEDDSEKSARPNGESSAANPNGEPTTASASGGRSDTGEEAAGGENADGKTADEGRAS